MPDTSFPDRELNVMLFIDWRNSNKMAANYGIPKHRNTDSLAYTGVHSNGSTSSVNEDVIPMYSGIFR